MAAQRSAAENFDCVFRFDFAALRKISLIVQRIDFDALDDAVGCELDDTPVIMFATAAARFPSIVHSRGAAGENQIVAGAEKHVAGFDDAAAIFYGSQIDEIAKCFRNNFAVDAQAGDASVGINMEAQMGVAIRIVDREKILRVASEG